MATEKVSEAMLVDESLNEQDQVSGHQCCHYQFHLFMLIKCLKSLQNDKPNNPSTELRKRPSKKATSKNNSLEYRMFDNEEEVFRQRVKKAPRSRVRVRSRLKKQLKRAKSRACFKLPMTVMKKRGRPKKK